MNRNARSAVELEVECLRVLAANPDTQQIRSIRIIRLCTREAGPNWTPGALRPEPTRIGFDAAQRLIAPLIEQFVLEE